jgi:hypothetical protein
MASSPLESAVSNFSFVLEQNARLITTVGTLSAISFAVVPILEQNYRAYIDAGRGGLPPNVYGWAKSSLLKIFLSYETTNTDMYLSDPNKDTWLDPSAITKRPGERPTFNWHPVPCRQLTQRADAVMHEVSPVSTPHARSGAETRTKKIQKLIPKYAKANPDLVKIALSPHEKQNDALVIHPDRPAPHQVATAAQREILHIHEGTDWSIHCLLSPLDCKLGKCGAVNTGFRRLTNELPISD